MRGPSLGGAFGAVKIFPSREGAGRPASRRIDRSTARADYNVKSALEDESMAFTSTPELEKLHAEAEASIKPFSYKKPESVERGKGFIRLATSPLIKGVVQVIKKNGGENNLHYHTTVDTFWMVLKGRVKFYGPEDVLLGDFGAYEGLITPRFSRYWFENAGEGDAELLQVAAADHPGGKSGRTDVSEQKFKVGDGPFFDAAKEPAKA
jgi:mannose-6-phosphate isomerase-like protein (cupin superfamily)